MEAGRVSTINHELFHAYEWTIGASGIKYLTKGMISQKDPWTDTTPDKDGLCGPMTYGCTNPQENFATAASIYSMDYLKRKGIQFASEIIQQSAFMEPANPAVFKKQQDPKLWDDGRKRYNALEELFLGENLNEKIKANKTMKLGRLLTTMFFVLVMILGQACSQRQKITSIPTIVPTETVPLNAGKDFNCWKAVSFPLAQTLKWENLLIISTFFSNNTWSTTLNTYSLSTQKTSQVTTIPDELSYVSISPDGRYVLYNKQSDNNLVIYDRAESVHHIIPNMTDFSHSFEQWTPDSQCLLIETAEKVWAYQLSDGTVQGKDIEERSRPEGRVIRQVEKSPDGKYTAWLCIDLNRICLINSKGQRIDHLAFSWPRLKENVPSMVALYGWSPDSQTLLFGFSSPGEPIGYIHTLRFVSFDKNGVTGYKDVGKWIIHDASWSPNGKSILVSTNKFLFYEVYTGKTTSITPKEDFVSNWKAVWMSDNESIVYLGQDNRSLYRVKTDGTDLEKLPVTLKTRIKTIFSIP